MYNEYKSVMSKKYFLLYLLYFAIFFATGPFEKAVPLILENVGLGEGEFGIFQSIRNIIFIFLPSIIAYISNRYKSSKVAISGILIGIISVFILKYTYNKLLIVFFIIVFSSVSTIFNYSINNDINANILSKDRSKYFAVRDVFLFGSIALGTMLLGRISGNYRIISVYPAFALLLLFAIVLILKISSTKGYIIEKTLRKKKL